ncbi:MAG: ATP synthase subunit delta [Candidatus Falkowbacteria bacterium GW2011_GWC2_38_22]|uniref:ATP synthase subunit delta n=1 Tax=Candidatus Falkowbacteria bacterium GW2011_GWE1_38_31 TaxID=1618638 RepID=A0A0G0N0Y8_9BACT|nr:MAG: ATP synthase subunit delta [Candidatus Falkowbacteria bacterium GW2011_GWF2_38_1205]KKQ61927.1 MAG: ATP synthase subunit delta [Candidatus Falkowbacteria bacterium GW2011_GWC2_38_22]KKQ63911.1 MAG: ATP synthase subunit delta [Candidatus Falkowbacteria bacterium GW2011_GWF1_38_22]KKQ66168.1 MAG: ATP synthase subunit delta [Candidatus Falkowbacteria bacterium GW2011_GWE2_38_254]KKQ70771.1 MAG: ATP synthase subunit delta [Candidatus Falkowbacteria bacterium GW2011_GWE1_38_31]KKQ73141.1 MA
MKIKAKQYALALLELLKDKKEKEISGCLDKFIKALIQNNQISQIDKILDFFNIYWNKEKSEIDAEVSSVEALDKHSLKEISGYIQTKSQAQKVNLIERQDKEILGGMVLKYGDKILDNSVRARLRGVKAEMLK